MNYFLYAMIYILVFLMGVTVFSYLNLVIERLPKKEKLTIRHSHCKQCDHEQTWKDVIPIFSRIRYQNRCRYCGSVLPKRPLIIELVGGAFAVFSVAMYGIHLSALLFFLVICDLMVITMIDADTQEIPATVECDFAVAWYPCYLGAAGTNDHRACDWTVRDQRANVYSDVI